MTGGSSGGGWITRRLAELGDQLRLHRVKNMLWGPYFGNVIQAVYDTASIG